MFHAMRRRFLLTGSLATAASMLAACGGTSRAPLPDLPAGPGLQLMVSELRIDDTYPPLPAANFIDERRTGELAQATRRLVQARLQPVGGVDPARASFTEVSLTERLHEERTGGAAGLITREPTYELEARVNVRISILDGAGNELAWARAGVGRSRLLRAGTSVLERDNAARSLIGDLMGQLDTALTQSVRENLATYLA